MAAVLSSNYFGAGAAAMQLDNGDTRIYYQGADGAIYRTSGKGSAVAGAKYSQGVVLVPADKVRVNTPLAVTAWGGFNEIRLYYIDRTNQIRELCYGFAGDNVPGALDSKNYKAAPNSGLLYAFSTAQGGRVGFQSADAPGVITEAQILQGGSWATAKLA